MASTMVNHHKLRKMESKKSHSWWWDSHVGTKHSKWLQENLEEMDQNVKRMLKLIEEDGDSFAKKAEMYYKKRPELINLVEEFYRMYRSLAERYDHVTGELRKNIPSDLQSQGSGVSDVGSEPPSTWPSPDHRLTRRRSGPPRAAGFDFFHVSGNNNSDLYNKEGDESSTLDSECESDDSSVNNYSAIASTDEDPGLRKRIVELELEIREMKEKYRLLQEDVSEGSYGESRIGNSEVMARLAGYEEELKVARQKIKSCEGEINRLKDELQKYRSLDFKGKDFNHVDACLEVNEEKDLGLQISHGDSEVIADTDNEIHRLEEELSTTRSKLLASETEVARLSKELQSNGSTIKQLQAQLGSAQKDISAWKNKIEREKREVSKLQDRIVRYKSSLSDRDQEIRGLREGLSNANKTLSEENVQLQADMNQLVKEKTYLEDNVKEMDLRCQSLEEEVRRIKAGKLEIEATLGAEIKTLVADIEAKDKHIEGLNKSLNELDSKLAAYVEEIGSKNIQIEEVNQHLHQLRTENGSKNIQIEEVNQHLHQLRTENVEMIDGAERTCKQVEELRCRVSELEQEVKRQQEVIVEGAEEKREAIRQLCFSLEHYRNGYHMLRKVVVGHKRPAVTAS